MLFSICDTLLRSFILILLEIMFVFGIIFTSIEASIEDPEDGEDVDNNYKMPEHDLDLFLTCLKES